MSFSYCGFPTEAMINFMANHRKTSNFRLHHLSGRGSSVFSLVISNGKYGLFNQSGASLTGLVSKAFKLYLEEAKQERGEFSSEFQALIEPCNEKDDEFKCVRRIAAELGLSMPESDEDILTYSTFRKIERALKHKESK